MFVAGFHGEITQWYNKNKYWVHGTSPKVWIDADLLGLIILWCTWLVYLMMYYWKHMLIWIGIHVETYGWMIGTCFMEDLAYMYGTHHFMVLVHSSTLIYGIA
jgi:hypothetical protein